LLTKKSSLSSANLYISEGGTYLIKMLDALVIELDNTLLGSDISLNGNNLSSHLRFLSSGIDLLSGRLEYILSTTIDDYLPLAQLTHDRAGKLTFAPLRARAVANALPRPVPPPVTMQDCPSADVEGWTYFTLDVKEVGRVE